MINIILPGDPIAKMRPRITKKGAYDPQHSLKHAAKFQVLTQVNRSILPFTNEIPIEIEMNFYFKASDSEKNLLKWGILDHTCKPDIDNLEKWILDCLSGIIYSDDKQVFRTISKKEFSDESRTEIFIVPKKPECSDQVKEVLSIISPEYITELSEMLSCISDWNHVNGNAYHQIESSYIDYEEVAFLILEFAEKHADNLKKINKKFPGLAKVLKEKMENK